MLPPPPAPALPVPHVLPTPVCIARVLQVLYHQDGDLEDLAYDTEEAAAMPATFHEMAELEAQGSWARFWWVGGTA